MKNLYIQPETLTFPPQYPTGDQHGCAFHLYPPCVCLPSPSLCVPHPTAGSPFSWIAPCALTTPARQHVRQPPSPHAPGQPRPLPDTGDAVQHPLSRSRDKITPRKPKTGTCHPCQSKSFTERGGPEEGTLFPKRPPLPENKPPSAKTTLPLPCPPPGGIFRSGPARARQPRRGQASATVRAGGRELGLLAHIGIEVAEAQPGGRVFSGAS